MVVQEGVAEGGYIVEKSIVDDFNSIFPGSEKPQIFRAPGRVNPIGEHTDYNMGFVCPTALNLAWHVAVTPKLRRSTADEVCGLSRKSAHLRPI
jgi:galactokinase